MNLMSFILVSSLMLTRPVVAGTPHPTLSPEQARERLTALTGFLNEALRLQPRQLLALHQYAGQELKLYVALAHLQSATGGLPPQGLTPVPGEEVAPPLPYLDQMLCPVLSDQQLAAFERLKKETRLVQLLQSPVFVR